MACTIVQSGFDYIQTLRRQAAAGCPRAAKRLKALVDGARRAQNASNKSKSAKAKKAA